MLGGNMDRTEVYRLIDGERAYQNAMEDKNGWQKKKAVGEWIVLIHHYTTEMDKAWAKNTGDTQALDVMRKIAGIAVHCMEQNGAPPRQMPGGGA